MENEKRKFVEQELNSDDYKRPVHGAKFLKQAAAVGSLVGVTVVTVVKLALKLVKNFIGMI